MKKLSLFLSAISVLLMVSCCNNCDKKDGQACDKAKQECCCKDCTCENCPCKKGCGEKKACNMTDEQKAECKAFGEKWANFDNLTPEEQKEMIAKKKSFIDEKREAMKAKMAECDAKWANFDNLTVAEQKTFLDSLPCQKNKKCGEKRCDKKPENCPNKEMK